MEFIKNDINKLGIMTDKMKIIKEFEAKIKNVSEYSDYNLINFILDELIKARDVLSKLNSHDDIGLICKCKVDRIIVRHEDKDWCNMCGELVKAS